MNKQTFKDQSLIIVELHCLKCDACTDYAGKLMFLNMDEQCIVNCGAVTSC